MFFHADDEKKLLFGMSQKCGCTHLKCLYNFLLTNTIEKDVQKLHNLPTVFYDADKHKDYHVVAFSRSPFARIVSAYRDKYSEMGEYRKLWDQYNPPNSLNFRNFVNCVTVCNPGIEKFHTFPQCKLCDMPNYSSSLIEVLMNNQVTLFDIKNIDYSFFQQFYNKDIPEEIVSFRGPHNSSFLNKTLDSNLSTILLDEIYGFSIPYHGFICGHTKKNIENIYMLDFEIFKYLGIDYKEMLAKDNK